MTGLYQDVYDCSMFYQCLAGIAFHKHCPLQLVFNPAIAVCDWPWNVQCIAVESSPGSHDLPGCAIQQPQTRDRLVPRLDDITGDVLYDTQQRLQKSSHVLSNYIKNGRPRTIQVNGQIFPEDENASDDMKDVKEREIYPDYGMNDELEVRGKHTNEVIHPRIFHEQIIFPDYDLQSEDAYLRQRNEPQIENKQDKSKQTNINRKLRRLFKILSEK